MITRTDIVIVGAGMVGLTAAAALADSELSITLVAQQPPQEPSNDIGLRVSAINQASVNAFKKLDVWPNIETSRLSPYSKMDVWDKDNIGRVQFSAEDVNEPQLGYIIENDVVTYALWQKVNQASNIQFIAGKIKQVDAEEDTALLMLEQGELIQAKMVIGADGANSSIRQMMNMPHTFSDYDQQAIVATIKTERPHQQTARQAFTEYGPLAFLPLNDPHLCSIVFSQKNAQIDSLLALDDEAFAKRLTAVTDSVLGRVEVVSKRAAFPLRMRYSRDFIKQNVLLIGDAAHTIHPLAGQGANLGFMDALAVSECLLNNGIDFDKLTETMRWRKSEAFDRIAAMEAFHRGFANDFKPLKLLRGIALSIADNVQPLKQKLIAEAMGTAGHLPELAK